MKFFVILLILIGFVVLIPQAFAVCLVNDDWSGAPCLDNLANGRYNQNEVNMWTQYYSYKGSEFMESAYLNLNQAIKEDRLEDWASESTQNRNVYEYYFFSGRAPNTGEYKGQFDVIEISKDDHICGLGAIYQDGVCIVYDAELAGLMPIRDYDYGLIYMTILLIVGIIGGVVGGIIFVIRRKRK